MKLNYEQALLAIKNTIAPQGSKGPLAALRERVNQWGHTGTQWNPLMIGDLKVDVPIVQGGMGVGISLSGLASAVANQGGIGVIAANAIGMIDKDYFKDGKAANIRALRSEIRKARQKTDGVIGVNIMVALNDFQDLLNVCIEEKVDIVFMGAGLPVKNIPVAALRKAGVKAVPIVSSARATGLIFKMWKQIYRDVPDAVVFEGPKAGGHLGFSENQLEDPEFQLEHIVPSIAETLREYETEFERKIPLIAGGGIYTGQDIHNAMKAGADAVQIGTRFAASEECDAHEDFKQALVNCTKEDIGLIKSPVGMPGRAIRNTFIRDSEEGKRPTFSCAWQCLSSCKAEGAQYCISMALNQSRRGKLNQGFVFAGSNAYRIKGIRSVASLFEEWTEEYREAVQTKQGAIMTPILQKMKQLKKQYEEAGSQSVKDLKAAYERVLLELFQVNGASSLSDL